MKRKLFLIETGIVCLSVFTVQLLTAQNIAPYWSITGNTNALTTSKFGTVNSVPLRIMTKNTEWIRVDTLGRVGIGTTAPSQKLYVIGNSVITGLLGLGVTPTQRLHVVGNGIFTGSIGVGINAVSSTARLNVVGSTTSGTGGNFTGYDFGLEAGSTSPGGYGIYGYSNNIGIYGTAASGTYGVYGYSGNTGIYGTGPNSGVYGYSNDGNGVYGSTYDGYGINGFSTKSYGGYFTSTDNYGLVATSTNAYYAGVFYGHIYTSGGLVTSDRNLKKDIHEFENAMSIINKLKPENYEFKDDAKYASLHLPKGRHYGLIAQDVEQVLPNLVGEAAHQLIINSKPAVVIKPTVDGKPQLIADATKEIKETINIKAVNYVELIPIMVKGMQEQETEIANLKSEINDLKALILKNVTGSTSTYLTGDLKQIVQTP